MHNIIFYKDVNGKEPVYEYILKLKENSNSKENRIKLNKIHDYIQALSTYGTLLNENYLKHLDDEIWELRLIRDRIMLAALTDGSFVLLHVF